MLGLLSEIATFWADLLSKTAQNGRCFDNRITVGSLPVTVIRYVIELFCRFCRRTIYNIRPMQVVTCEST